MRATTEARAWVYFRIHLGFHAAKTQSFLLCVCRQVAALGAVRRWFYVHYTDEDGPHIRLRIELSDAGGRARLDVILATAMDDLPHMITPAYAPVVMRHAGPRVGGGADRASDPAGPRVTLHDYEPDTSSFGEGGVDIAEDLAHVSSGTAIAIMEAEVAGGVSRKSLIPRIMRSTADSFERDADRDFWTGYAGYWLSLLGVDQARTLARFEGKARRLIDSATPIFVPDTELDQNVVAVLDDWAIAGRRAADRFRLVGGPALLGTPRQLAYHFIHLMNNQLGLFLEEEPYYATLIAEAQRSGQPS